MSTHKQRPQPSLPSQPPQPAQPPQQPPLPEPTPVLTEAEKRQLTEYVRRDTIYQQALDRQHRRHIELAGEKKREIEVANAEKRLRQQPGALPFGLGYAGYGNSLTGKQQRIIYPAERKRPRRTKELKYLSDAIIEQANKEDTLVPIRLEIDGEGYKLRDTFTWNLNETTVTPDHFAEVLCDDLKLPSPSFVPSIAKAIREQVQDFYTHAPARTDDPVDAGDGKSEEEAAAVAAAAAAAAAMDPRRRNEELRILIKLDITVGNRSLIDQFEWDINCAKNDPEQFAEILATELGLGGEFKTAIAHSIREQIHVYVKSLLLIGHDFDGSPIQDDDLRQSFMPAVSNVIREEDAVENFTPLLIDLSDAEIDKIEKDRERDARRKRRQTRGRRGVILPDREPLKTHRTLLAVPSPAEMTDEQFLLAAGVVQPTITSSSHRASTPSSSHDGAVGGMSGAGSLSASRRAGFRARPGDVRLNPSSPSPAGTPVRETPRKMAYRGRTDNKVTEEWACANCGCPESATPLLRKGPLGEKSLCNACGLYYQKNNTARPLANGDDGGDHHLTNGVAADAAMTSKMREAAAAAAEAEMMERGASADAQAAASGSETNSAANSPSTPLPDWIVIQRDRLLEKFPGDRFDIIQRGSGEFRIKCYDCPGKLYTLGPGTLENFEIHLNNRQHRFAVEQRLATHGA